MSSEINVPVIISGSMGKQEDLLLVVKEGGVDGVAMADILHYKRSEINEIRVIAKNAGIEVRNYEHA